MVRGFSPSGKNYPTVQRLQIHCFSFWNPYTCKIWQIQCSMTTKIFRYCYKSKVRVGWLGGPFSGSFCRGIQTFQIAKKVNGMNHMRLLFVNSVRILQFRCSAFVFPFDEGKYLDQYEIWQFCIKLGLLLWRRHSFNVRVRELWFWYLLLIADIYRTSRSCKCNESILFFRCAFCRFGRLG